MIWVFWDKSYHLGLLGLFLCCIVRQHHPSLLSLISHISSQTIVLNLIV